MHNDPNSPASKSDRTYDARWPIRFGYTDSEDKLRTMFLTASEARDLAGRLEGDPGFPRDAIRTLRESADQVDAGTYKDAPWPMDEDVWEEG